MHYEKTRQAAAMLFSLFALNAQASLTPTANDLGVYQSSIDATWTQDANLLGTLESTQGYDTVINAIINANGGLILDTANDFDTVANSGTYTLTATDFGSGGAVNWWAAVAFVHYLNSENYGGSSQWALPTSNAINGYDKQSQLGKLFYDELGGTAGNTGLPTYSTGPFSNIQYYSYWSGTEYAAYYGQAWIFSTSYGFQVNNYKPISLYAWAVSPGQIPIVPLPGTVWLFGLALAGFIGFKHQKMKNA